MHGNLLSLAVALTLVSPAVAHVVLESPKPFRFVEYGPTNPISPSGLDFPCKIPPGAKLETDGAPTVMAIGEEQTASFSGQAVHGGGSCQFSVSGPINNGSWTDYPLKDLDWKVIHSIEGGCPARNQKGNLDGPNQDKFTFKIPEGIAPGDYIFSWTWLARIGRDPEYYQNCAPITVISTKIKRRTKSDRRALLANRMEFPGLFMANMGEVSGGCTTEEALGKQLAIAFPNPGSSVYRPEGTANLFRQQCDGNPRAKKGQAGSPADSPSMSTASQPNATPTSSTILFSVTSLIPPSSLLSSTSVELVSTPTSEITAISSSSPGSCTEGHLTCLEDGIHFATCTGGQLTPPQPIAPGFKCKVGSGLGLDILPA
ncbi:hypothetical protein F4804DRAFT_348359 [Jackrogersella minutella]|nr:hypothetical protein F4804DRAFT_348359 [Jackrogersella minutella]